MKKKKIKIGIPLMLQLVATKYVATLVFLQFFVSFAQFWGKLSRNPSNDLLNALIRLNLKSETYISVDDRIIFIMKNHDDIHKKYKKRTSWLNQ